MTAKLVRILANTNNKTLPTVNIKTSGGVEAKTHAQTASPVKGVHPTYQDSGGTVKGLKTIIIPGYVAPA